jgi:WD40 repeat protein
MKPTLLLCFLCFSLLATATVFAQDPPGVKRFTNQMVHSASVNSVCFSPDGRYALSGSNDHTIKLWEVSTGNEIRTLKGHSEWVNSVCFSPDGRYALSGSQDNTLKLWEVSTGNEIRTLKGHSKWVNSVCFSPDGRYALSGSFDETIKLWEVSTGNKIRTLKGDFGSVSSVCFSPDGRYALSGSWRVKLWEVSTGNEIRTFKGDGNHVASVCFSPDGRYALSGSGDNVKLWEVSTGNEIRTLKGHSSDLVNSVCFSPDGQYALSGSGNGTSGDGAIKLWEVSTGNEIRTLKGHSSYCHSVCFSPDGRYALSGNLRGTLKLWEVSTGNEIRTLKGHSDLVNSVCFSPDGRYALSGSGGDVKLWEVSTGNEIRTFKGHSSHVASVCFSPDGRYALSGSLDNTLKLWEVSTGNEIRTLKGGIYLVNSVCFSPDGRYALSGNWRDLKLWEVSTGNEIRTFKGDGNHVASVCFSPDGRYALSGSGSDVKLWEVSTGNEIRTLKGHSEWVNSVCFSPDGRYALSGSSDNTLKLWDVSTGNKVRTLKGYRNGIHWVCFSPDGRYALSGSGDWTVKLWEVSSGKEVKSWSLNYRVKQVAFTPDGAGILVGTAAYFVSFPLNATRPVTPTQPQTQTVTPPASVFSQVIWTSQTATVREPAYTARAVVVSNSPAPITAGQVRVYVNGKPLAEGQKMDVVSLKAAQGRYDWQQRVPLQEGDNELVLGLMLPNQPEVRSEALMVRYEPPTRPNLYVVAVGVSGLGLKYPTQDADALEKLLKGQQGKLFNRVRTTMLNQPGQTHTTRLRTEMGKLPVLFDNITPNDVLLVFVSAHGRKFNARNGQTDFAIQPEDYDGTNLSTEETTTLLYKQHIVGNIESLPCKKLILFDACHSGEAVLKQGGKSPYLQDLREAQEVIKRTPASIVTLSSSSDGQLSYEDDAWQHGAFTKALLDGLAGAADLPDAQGRKDGYVWISELFQYLQKTVPPLVKQRKNENQTPQMYPATLAADRDFPLVQY